MLMAKRSSPGSSQDRHRHTQDRHRRGPGIGHVSLCTGVGARTLSDRGAIRARYAIEGAAEILPAQIHGRAPLRMSAPGRARFADFRIWRPAFDRHCLVTMRHMQGWAHHPTDRLAVRHSAVAISCAHGPRPQSRSKPSRPFGGKIECASEMHPVAPVRKGRIKDALVVGG